MLYSHHLKIITHYSMQISKWIALSAAVILLGQGCASAQPAATTAPKAAAPAAAPQAAVEVTRIVEYVEGGFSPNEVTIAPGTTVKFVNRTDAPVWPASDPHPIHTALSGFDALRGLGRGESYSFKFDQAGEWKFHNHLSPGVTGKIIVQ